MGRLKHHDPLRRRRCHQGIIKTNGTIRRFSTGLPEYATGLILPQPERPIIASISPCLASRLTLSKSDRAFRGVAMAKLLYLDANSAYRHSIYPLYQTDGLLSIEPHTIHSIAGKTVFMIRRCSDVAQPLPYGAPIHPHQIIHVGSRYGPVPITDFPGTALRYSAH